MILLRQRLYGDSSYYSQSGIEWGPESKDYTWVNGNGHRGVSYKDCEVPNKISEQVLGKSGSKENKRRVRKLRKNKGIYVSGGKENHKMALSFHEGLSDANRKIIHTFESTKDPVSAYRDFLRAREDRMNAGDVFGEAKASISNKEIKDAIRKNARKQAMISKAKKAAPWAIGGTLAAGATIAGVHAYKKHKKSK